MALVVPSRVLSTIEDVPNPSEVAVSLLGKQHRVLAGEPATRYALEELKIPKTSVMAPHRLEEWKRNCAAAERSEPVTASPCRAKKENLAVIQPRAAKRMTDNVKQSGNEDPLTTRKTGTIGVVCLDAEGNIVALTSTGGTGFEARGRVSDSGTAACCELCDRGRAKSRPVFRNDRTRQIRKLRAWIHQRGRHVLGVRGWRSV